MCSRYKIREMEDDDEAFEEIIAILQRRPSSEGMKASGDALPTDILPVIARSRRGEKSAFAMRWGYTMPGGGCVINARSETAHEKPLFQDGMKQRRCVIPAKWYYEWETRGREKVRYAIRPSEPGLTYMAGIYRPGTGIEPAQFVILTRDAAPDVAFIHPRMPVLLPQAAIDAWLSEENAESILRVPSLHLEFGAA